MANIDNMVQEGVEAAQQGSPEYQAGFKAGLELAISIGLEGFGGDACDFAEWLREKING